MQAQVALMGLAPPQRVSGGGIGFFRESEPVLAPYSAEQLHANHRRRKLLIAAILAGLIAIAAIAIVAVALTGNSGQRDTKPVEPVGSALAGSAAGSQVGSAIAPVPQGSATTAPPTGSQAAVTPVATPDAAESGTCTVEISTVPAGAQILRDNDVLGTTPASIELPCGVEAKLVIRKAKFLPQTRTITPAAEMKLELALERPMFTIRVMSTPSSATVTVGGKSQGVTPTTIKLPAFEASVVTVTKDGFVPDTTRVTARQNNMPYHVTLKRGGRH